MTKKRWIVLAGLLAVCVALTLAFVALLPADTGVTPANFDRIENAMTLEEVETILGGPGRDISEAHWGDRTIIFWSDPETETNIFVYYDDANRVIGKDCRHPETFMQKLRHLL